MTVIYDYNLSEGCSVDEQYIGLRSSKLALFERLVEFLVGTWRFYDYYVFLFVSEKCLECFLNLGDEFVSMNFMCFKFRLIMNSDL